MNDRQRDVVALVSGALAVVLFVSYFLVDFLRWVTWHPRHDLFSQLVAIRPGFPNDWQNVVLGLIVPVVLVGLGLYLRSADRRRS
jgi:hypothetical protein